jgi:hypothetical protein
MSSKVTLSADGLTATVATATVGDIFTTAISTTEALTGMYGGIQKAGLVALGMAYQNNKLTGSFNPFK